MHRRLVSVLLAGFSVSVLAGTAIALGNSVSTTPAPAFVRSVDTPTTDGAATAREDMPTSTTRPGTEVEHDRDGGFNATPSATTSTTALTSPPPDGVTAVPAPGDDPAAHDVGDDHGNDATTVDDLAGVPTTSTTVLPSSGGQDDPITHDLGDDHAGSGGSGGNGSGSGSTSGSGSGGR